MEKEQKKLAPHELVRLFIRTDKLHRSLIEQRVQDLNLHRSQHIMLSSILSFESPPTQKQLAQKLDISAATVAVTVKKLEQAAFIEKSTDEGDSRCNKIIITNSGKDILMKARKIFEEVDHSMFEGLSENELEIFVQCLEKLQENLKSKGATLPDKCCH